MAKKAAKKKKTKDVGIKASDKSEAFYVGVPTPVNTRRNLLETSKDILAMLKQFEHLKQVRAQKKEAMSEFNKVVKDIKQGINAVKKKLPDVPIRQAPKTPKQVIAEQPQKGHVVQHETAELTKLEAELQRIEEKLGSM